MAFIGASGGANSSSSTSSSNQTSNKTFSAPQTKVQDQLGGNLSTDLAAAATGGLSPGVTAQKTQAADAINKESNGLTDRMTKFLAQRGFGKSGQTGKVALQGELGRQAALGNNEASFAGQQTGINQGNLLAALNYALTNLGTTASATGASTGESSGWGVSGGVGYSPKGGS